MAGGTRYDFISVSLIDTRSCDTLHLRVLFNETYRLTFRLAARTTPEITGCHEIGRSVLYIQLSSILYHGFHPWLISPDEFPSTFPSDRESLPNDRVIPHPSPQKSLSLFLSLSLSLCPSLANKLENYVTYASINYACHIFTTHSIPNQTTHWRERIKFCKTESIITIISWIWKCESSREINFYRRSSFVKI